jgi:16S rRNA (adenine1518-N6/adenine1519-N6)-dimethyltransferase
MYRNLTDVNYLKNRLKQAGLSPQRSSGQNFLICQEAVEATVLALHAGTTKITELGAGIGSLTVALLAAGFEVRAIEREERLTSALLKEVAKPHRQHLQIIRDDLRSVNWWWETGSGGDKYQLVGNIPYNLSGLIIRRLVQLAYPPDRVVFMVQREVGERITAQTPNMGLISLAVQLWGRAEIIMQVPADCFWPRPKVESCLVMLIPRQQDVISLREREKIMAVAKTFFMAKRKQMAGVLKNHYQLQDRREAEKLLERVKITETQRPQELGVEQWQALAGML